MVSPSPSHIFLLGIILNGIAVGFFFLPFEIQYIGWVLILVGSIVLFLAGYLWFNDLITKLSKRASK